jgi:alpha,alpha-trehalase
MPGGVATTLVASGQQWDQPNGWAPVQWVAVVGLNNYHMSQLAETIARRWACENIDGYHVSRTFVGKYNLVRGGGGGGGEAGAEEKNSVQQRKIAMDDCG